jgi:hypothetical protein
MERGRFLRYERVGELAAEAHAMPRCHYRVTMPHRVGDLEERLQRIAELVIVGGDGDHVVVEYHKGVEAASTLLHQLVEAGVRVCEFRAVGIDLEQLYLQTGVRQVD